jgi:hypothetical protein
MKGFRLLFFVAVLFSPALALANGAMGYALEVFDFRVWTVYVVATIALEAGIIGRFLGHSWPKSLGLSLLFNALTALCCASGGWAPFLHAMVVDGNPVLWTFELLVTFGIISALAEAIMWQLTAMQAPGWPMFKKVLYSHAVGVPLALLILLIPSRPYPGYEAVATSWRYLHLRQALGHVYDDRTDKDGNVRQFGSFRELENRLDEMGGYGACLYDATYPRFATKDPRVQPLEVELNQRPSTDNVDWLIRIEEHDRTVVLDSDQHVGVEFRHVR